MFRTTVGRPGIVVQTPQLEHISPSRRGRRGGEVQAETVRSRARRCTAAPGGRRRTPRVSRIRRTAENDRSVSSATWRSESPAWYCSTTKVLNRRRSSGLGRAGTSRCRGTPATAGAAGGAGRTRSHDAARPWVRQCARRLLQWGQSLTARPARGARRAPRPRPARPGHRRPRRTSRGRTTRRRAAPTRPAGPARPPTLVARQAAHPAVPGTRGPLATDPGQRRPLGQRQAVPPGRHPAGHRSSLPAIEHSFAQRPVQRLCGRGRTSYGSG